MTDNGENVDPDDEWALDPDPQVVVMQTTYRRADGELIAGDYSTVTDLDYFDDEAREVDRLEVIEERWMLMGKRTVVLGATERWCYECDEDITLDEPVDGPVYCPKHQPEHAESGRNVA